jgi:hypothetical protein
MNEIVGRELQINIHPNDCKHFEILLRHQIRTWGDEVDRVRLTLDLHNSESGRYRSDSFADNLRKMYSIIDIVSRDISFLTVDEVDTSVETRHAIAQKYFNRDDLPIKAWDGGPFYSYLFGLWKVRGKTVIHMDSDMMFGGLSHTWIREAEDILDANSNVIFVAPLSGPPHPDGILKGHGLQPGIPIKKFLLPHSYSFNSVSTRIFVTRPELIDKRMGFLEWLSPSMDQKLRSILLGNPPDSREFEVVLSHTMRKRGLIRVDYLGEGSGMWSLHPPFRTEHFYRDLPNIIHRIETGDLPNEQLGCYDLHDSICDWSVPRRNNTKFRRLYRQTLRAIKRISI